MSWSPASPGTLPNTAAGGRATRTNSSATDSAIATRIPASTSNTSTPMSAVSASAEAELVLGKRTPGRWRFLHDLDGVAALARALGFEGRFREGVHKADVSDMMRRLTKEELYRFDGTPLFPERRAYTSSFALSPQ